jgi:hypothetical protein
MAYLPLIDFSLSLAASLALSPLYPESKSKRLAFAPSAPFVEQPALHAASPLVALASRAFNMPSA